MLFLTEVVKAKGNKLKSKGKGNLCNTRQSTATYDTVQPLHPPTAPLQYHDTIRNLRANRSRAIITYVTAKSSPTPMDQHASNHRHQWHCWSYLIGVDAGLAGRSSCSGARASSATSSPMLYIHTPPRTFSYTVGITQLVAISIKLLSLQSDSITVFASTYSVLVTW